MQPTRFFHGFFSLLAVVLAATLSGCGGSGSLAPVSGKVIYQGQPVKGGSLIFSPVGEGKVGKAGSADVGDDGAFTVKTDAAAGAGIGKHRVTYTPAEAKMTEEQRKDPKFTPPPSPYLGLAPKDAEVEVKSGANDITIELVKKK
jgi:hypothetical protein